MIRPECAGLSTGRPPALADDLVGDIVEKK